MIGRRNAGADTATLTPAPAGTVTQTVPDAVVTAQSTFDFLEGQWVTDRKTARLNRIVAVVAAVLVVATGAFGWLQQSEAASLLAEQQQAEQDLNAASIRLSELANLGGLSEDQIVEHARGRATLVSQITGTELDYASLLDTIVTQAGGLEIRSYTFTQRTQAPGSATAASGSLGTIALAGSASDVESIVLFEQAMRADPSLQPGDPVWATGSDVEAGVTWSIELEVLAPAKLDRGPELLEDLGLTELANQPAPDAPEDNPTDPAQPGQ